MQFPVLQSGLVSRVGAPHTVVLIAPSPLGQNSPRKNYYETMKQANNYLRLEIVCMLNCQENKNTIVYSVHVCLIEVTICNANPETFPTKFRRMDMNKVISSHKSF